jgi:hypothetical protein
MTATVAALMAPAVVQTAQAADRGDARLIAVCERFLAVDRDIECWDAGQLEWTQDQSDEAITQWYVELEALTAIRAMTPAGALAKAKAAYRSLASLREDHVFGREEEAALAALADITGRAVA